MVSNKECGASDLATSTSTDFKASRGNSAWSASMTMGSCGLTCLISSATKAPSKRPKWYSRTIASTDCDIKSRKPSLPVVAVISPYPFSFNRFNWVGSRCIHSKVLVAAMLKLYKRKLYPILFNIAHKQECRGEKVLLLCLLDPFRARSFVCPELLRSKGLSTGAASPLWVLSHQASLSEAEPAIFAGMKRHYQFTATLQALSLSHSHVVTTSLAAFVWSQLNTS
jgi:hypothetical protein